MRNILGIAVIICLFAPSTFAADVAPTLIESAKAVLGEGTHTGPNCYPKANVPDKRMQISEQEMQSIFHTDQQITPVDPDVLSTAKAYVQVAGDPDARFTVKRQTPYTETGLLSPDINVVLYKNSKRIVIVKRGSAAESAGVQAGDILLAVNGKNVTNLTIDETREMLHVKKGIAIALLVSRSGKNLLISFTPNKLEVAKSFEIVRQKNVLFITIRFLDFKVAEIRSALAEKDLSSIDGIVLDLRDNQGGLLDDISIIANIFLPKGSPYYQALFFDNSICSYVTSMEPLISMKIPLIVLINQGTSSGAEILASALKDRQFTTLAGEPTLGMSDRMDMLIDFKDGSSLIFRVAKLLTQRGANIADVGIRPDIINRQKIRGRRDPLLTRAIAELNTLKAGMMR